jgi:hypothetical protein
MGVPRKIVQIAAATSGESPGHFYATLFALADDGTAWAWNSGDWIPVLALPEAEACGARVGHDGEDECRLAKGHRDHHWSGGRKWA